MKMTPAAELYQTSEYALAAALCTHGFAVEYIDRENDQRVKFSFKRELNLDDVVATYWNGTLNVPVMSFYQNLKLLKARIRNDIR